MSFRPHILLVVPVLICAGCAEESMNPVAATSVCVHVSGTLAETLDTNRGNLPSSSYAYESILGGTFEGEFSYDLNTAPSDTFTVRTTGPAPVDSVVSYEYTLLDVEITIKDRAGIPVHVIQLSQSRIGTQVDGTRTTLRFGEGAGNPNIPNDLRLGLSGQFAPGGALPNPAALEQATLRFAILETDGVDPYTFWVLPITTATIASIPCVN